MRVFVEKLSETQLETETNRVESLYLSLNKIIFSLISESFLSLKTWREPLRIHSLDPSLLMSTFLIFTIVEYRSDTRWSYLLIVQYCGFLCFRNKLHFTWFMARLQVSSVVADLHCKILDAPPVPPWVQILSISHSFCGKFWQNRMLAPPG